MVLRFSNRVEISDTGADATRSTSFDELYSFRCQLFTWPRFLIFLVDVVSKRKGDVRRAAQRGCMAQPRHDTITLFMASLEQKNVELVGVTGASKNHRHIGADTSGQAQVPLRVGPHYQMFAPHKG